MSQSPYPSGPGPGRAPRKRPRPWWFVIGGVLLALAGIVFVLGLLLTLRPLFQQDAVFVGDSRPVKLNLPAHEQRAIFLREGTTAQCQLRDQNDQPVRLRTVNGSFTSNNWVAVLRFDTGEGDLTIRCETSGSNAWVRVGGIPSTTGFVSGILVTVLAPLLLGLAGVVVLIVTTIRWFTAAPPPPAPPAA